MSVELAELHCERCDLVTDHELHYTGRLLESVRCTRCGTHLEVPPRGAAAGVLARPGAADRQQAAADVAPGGAGPAGLPAQLPRAVVRQPAKLVGELRAIFRH